MVLTKEDTHTYERDAVLVRKLESVVADLFSFRVGNTQGFVGTAVGVPLLLDLDACEERVEGEVAEGQDELGRVRHEQRAQVGESDRDVCGRGFSERPNPVAYRESVIRVFGLQRW